LEVTLHNGTDPVSGKKVGLVTGDPCTFRSYEALYDAFLKQIHYFVDMKVRVSNYIDRMFAKYAPATFLSLFIDDCIAKGKDYYNCGPRYNTSYIQCTGLGTITDSLSVLKKHVFEERKFNMEQIIHATDTNFEGQEAMRQFILNRTPFFGNDDEYADRIAIQIFNDLYDAIEGKPNTKGECFHLNMLSTTCHVYFGKMMNATPNGRLAGRAISDGTSPSHGADTHGPSAVIKSLGKLDQVKSGGTYEREVIPYWKGRTQRERIFNHVPKEWKEAYEVGMFTEFMEQRAPGHTSLDGKVYQHGMLDLKERIAHELKNLDFMNDPEATDKQEELTAMSISCDAAIIFAERHAELAEKMAGQETDPKRKEELKKIAEICRWVPAHAPRTYWEAIQMYWFVHLGTITELNGWDAMNPGHFDQHLAPFYEKDLEEGILTRAEAKELMSCFFIKVNNQTAPPKVGITAKESGTYNDFTNLNIGGIKRDGSNGVSEVSYIMLETVDDLHLLQPGSALHISVCTPERFLREGCKVIRKGYGYPSVFNPDTYVMELMRQGKTPEDAREGG
jgi:pyruvate-formate lyase